MDIVSIVLLTAATAVGLFVIYNALHYALFLLVTHPKDARNIGDALKNASSSIGRQEPMTSSSTMTKIALTMMSLDPIEASKTTTVHVCFRAQFFRLRMKPNTFSLN